LQKKNKEGREVARETKQRIFITLEKLVYY